MWEAFSQQKFMKAEDSDYILLQHGFDQIEHLPNKPMLLIGSPLNPEKLIEIYVEA